MIDIKSLIEDKVNALWAKYPNEEFAQVPPLSVDCIPDNRLLFIGINPSLAEADRATLLERSSKTIDFYALNHDSMHRYFNKFIDIAEEVSSTKDWAHIDLLYVRETEQKKIADAVKSDERRPFIYEQLMITKSILDKVIASESPRVIVVNNTLARYFLGKDKDVEKNIHIWMGYDFVWSEELGTYLLGKHPVFFTSMLTGQRALDNGSFERLVWHIKFVMRNL